MLGRKIVQGNSQRDGEKLQIHKDFYRQSWPNSLVVSMSRIREREDQGWLKLLSKQPSGGCHHNWVGRIRGRGLIGHRWLRVVLDLVGLKCLCNHRDVCVRVSMCVNLESQGEFRSHWYINVFLKPIIWITLPKIRTKLEKIHCKPSMIILNTGFEVRKAIRHNCIFF
jgi:hypothetical protein